MPRYWDGDVERWPSAGNGSSWDQIKLKSALYGCVDCGSKKGEPCRRGCGCRLCREAEAEARFGTGAIPVQRGE
jgi:hypothetical protein